MELFEAFEAIKKECDKHWDCETCPIHLILCDTDEYPCNWDMEYIKKELKE